MMKCTDSRLNKGAVVIYLLCLISNNKLYECVSKFCLIYFGNPFDIPLWYLLPLKLFMYMQLYNTVV